jgi:hypothetical protein
MKRKAPPPEAIRAALMAQSLRLACDWILQLPDGREIVRRYQQPVSLARVLDEHRNALAAWPVEY